MLMSPCVSMTLDPGRAWSNTYRKQRDVRLRINTCWVVLTVHSGVMCWRTGFSPLGAKGASGFRMFTGLKGCPISRFIWYLLTFQPHPHGAGRGAHTRQQMFGSPQSSTALANQKQTKCNCLEIGGLQPNVGHQFASLESITNSEGNYLAPIICKILHQGTGEYTNKHVCQRACSFRCRYAKK